jgi:hypothetical protein
MRDGNLAPAVLDMLAQPDKGRGSQGAPARPRRQGRRHTGDDCIA